MSPRPPARLHVFLGTKAQYIKTAPLMHLLDERGIEYFFIDSGQHARISTGMRTDLGIREPDLVLGGENDIESVGQALRWSVSLGAGLWSGKRLRERVFGGHGGLCVVHGDTPSTFLAALMARRAGLRVAHLEAGLRSRSLLHPFPEELIRLAVMRVSDILFASDDVAVANLQAMRLQGRIVALDGNTSVDAVRYAGSGGRGGPAGDRAGQGPVIVTMHRVENLHSRRVVERLVALVVRIAASHPVRFVLHGPTSKTLTRHGHDRVLADAGVEMVPLMAHNDFVQMLRAAPFVITDGGSIQEEVALLGVPTLLWRQRTERPDGLGANVVLSHYDQEAVERFLADPEALRVPPADRAVSPSEQILEVLLAELRALDS